MNPAIFHLNVFPVGTTPPPVGGEFITRVTPGTGRQDVQSDVGFQGVVGAAPITITALGRYAAPGNSGVHTVTLWRDYTSGQRGFLTSASVNMAGSTPGQFVYAALPTPFVLWENTPFFLSSQEGGGDTWYDVNTVLSPTGDASVLSAVFYNQDGFQGRGNANNSFVPVGFKYNLGVAGGITQRGSPFVDDAVNQFLFNVRNVPNEVRVLKGQVTLIAVQIAGGGIPAGNVTYQWSVDGVPTGPVSTGPVGDGLAWIFDSNSIPDGTHVFYPVVYDFTGPEHAQRFLGCASTFIVANHGFNNGTQVIPCVNQRALGGISQRPDFVTYTAGKHYPARTPRPISYNFIPGAPSDPRYSSNPAIIRNRDLWIGESWVGYREGEYFSNPEFVTSPDGGVHVYYLAGIADDSPIAPSAYLPVTFQNSMDGPSLNSWISPFSNFVEDPAGGSVWWGVEVNGRVVKLTPDGETVTIVGRVRDRSQLTYDPEYPGLTEDLIDTKIINRGNFPAEFDNLGGANDICFDPRDPDIFYVVSQVDHFVARCNRKTLNLTLYAGTPGTPGYTGDGGPATSATFDNPSSIIMDPTGIMYVCDTAHSAIRKITPDGTITTLCGGRVGPPNPGYSAITTVAGTYAVNSIVWNSATNTGTVIMADATTTIKLGYSLDLNGATNSGGSGDSNRRYIVTAFVDSKHFTIGLDPVGNPPTIGTIGGSPVFTVWNMDVYSSPTPVPFASAYLVAPNSIRFTSSGDIAFFENPTYAVRLINLRAGTISRVGLHNTTLRHDLGNGWSWITVDTAGMCGPKDDIITVSINDAIQSWRNSIDGTHSAASFEQGGWAVTRYGPNSIFNGTHYPWAIQFSKFEGRFLINGIAGSNPIVYRIMQPNDLIVDPSRNLNINLANITSGGPKVRTGTMNGFPLGVRPPFWALRGQSGMGFVIDSPGRNTHDDLHETFPTDAAFGAYIQAGMGGAVPRPEIVGNQLRDFIYAIRRGTYAGSMAPAQPGPDDPNTITPLILSISAVRNSPTKITVSWTTDVPTLGMVGVYTPAQRAIGAKPSIFSDLESGFSTTHSMPVMVLAGVSPVNYMVICESSHGIFAHTTDQVFS